LTKTERFDTIQSVIFLVSNWGFPLAKKQTSAQKRFKQSEARRLHNKAIKSRCRTAVKHFIAAVQNKEQQKAEEMYNLVQKELDSARSKGVLKRNTAARKKSRMKKLFNVTFSAPQEAAAK